MTDIVSIIVPCYNAAVFIAETIATVQQQTYQYWELIIVDDCSTDTSREIIRTFLEKDERIRLVELDVNSGRPAVPRNIGCALAIGNYIAFLDADDLWHRQKLELQLDFMKRNNAAFSCTEFERFSTLDEIKELSNITYTEAHLKGQITHWRLIQKNIINNSSVMVEKKLMDMVDFIEDIRYKAIEDYHCWLLIHQFHIAKSPILKEKLVFYRLVDTSISRSKVFMLQKNAILYSEYTIGGRKLGLRKYLYMFTYICYSIVRKFIK
ncbi:MAG: glycosyltransferase family 2 protein [Ignavibacteriae bacterium]|nr:glycosyltransferase family 2 protein [Ignavibacteriota bacterium]